MVTRAQPLDSPQGSLLPGAIDWQAFGQACAGCHRCGLAGERLQVVVSRGNPWARLMLIGEAPGVQEDLAGQPFVGRSGQLLDQLLAEAGFDLGSDVYICNAVKCRPPGNRKPTAAELAACRPWLEQQITSVNPPLILLLGSTALEGVLGLKTAISKLRGQWLRGEGPLLADRWLMPLFHPSYLLRNPSSAADKPKGLTLADLRQVAARLQQVTAAL